MYTVWPGVRCRRVCHLTDSPSAEMRIFHAEPLSREDYTTCEVRAPALALYATVSQAILPADASAEQRAAVARFERENNAPWTAESIAQFRRGVRNGRVERIAGVHHLFLDRPEETLQAIVRFLRESTPLSRP